MVGFNQSKGFLSQPSGGTGGGGFSSYAAGKKSYGLGQRSAPNVGKRQTRSATDSVTAKWQHGVMLC